MQYLHVCSAVHFYLQITNGLNMRSAGFFISKRTREHNFKKLIEVLW